MPSLTPLRKILLRAGFTVCGTESGEVRRKTESSWSSKSTRQRGGFGVKAARKNSALSAKVLLVEKEIKCAIQVMSPSINQQGTKGLQLIMHHRLNMGLEYEAVAIKCHM